MQRGPGTVRSTFFQLILLHVEVLWTRSSASLPRASLFELFHNTALNENAASNYIICMQEYAPSPQWRRILNACLAGLSSIVGMDMALAWGWHFLLDREGNLPSGAPASPGIVTLTTVVLYGLGLVLSVVLARWQWKRSSKSTQMHETLMTGAWLLLCILFLTRPRF